MRRKDKEINDANEIEEILKKATNCRLGLCYENKPYVIPLSYGYKSGYLYFHSAKEGKKMDIIRKNDNVCFQIDVDNELISGESPCKYSMKYKSIIGFGKAQIINDVHEKQEALRVIMRSHNYTGEIVFNEKAINEVVIIRVKIDEMSGKKSGY